MQKTKQTKLLFFPAWLSCRQSSFETFPFSSITGKKIQIPNIVLINTVFFWLQLEGSVLTFVYLNVASTFGSTEPSSSTEHKNINHRQFWYEKGKWQCFHLWEQKLQSFLSSSPLLHTEPKASSFGQSSNPCCSPKQPSWRSSGGGAADDPHNSWFPWPCPAEQGHLLTGMRRLRWWHPPPSQMLMLGWWPPGNSSFYSRLALVFSFSFKLSPFGLFWTTGTFRLQGYLDYHRLDY